MHFVPGNTLGYINQQHPFTSMLVQIFKIESANKFWFVICGPDPQYVHPATKCIQSTIDAQWKHGLLEST